jgi:hypothetical protein
MQYCYCVPLNRVTTGFPWVFLNHKLISLLVKVNAKIHFPPENIPKSSQLNFIKASYKQGKAVHKNFSHLSNLQLHSPLTKASPQAL